ncbi:putative adenine-specific DNA methylase [Escherichia coli 3-373-03_S1_C2]|nr:putative adenine-specific DNA methylase [Escherichia coli 3-373-03_S1_C2]
MSRFVLGNCIDVMARIPDNAIDFILTAPPRRTSSVFVTVSGAPLPVMLMMTGCNLPAMRCTAYSKKTR